MNSYPVGQAVKVRVTCKDDNNDLIDPTSITVIMHDCSGVDVTYEYPGDAEIVRASEGAFYLKIVPCTPGKIVAVYWKTEGNIELSGEIAFETLTSQVI